MILCRDCWDGAVVSLGWCCDSVGMVLRWCWDGAVMVMGWCSVVIAGMVLGLC